MAGVLAGAALIAGVGWVQGMASGVLTFAVASVGQGSFTLLTTPLGLRVAIDAGPTPTEVRTALARLASGVRRIDLVVATHPDADHIGGVRTLLRHYEVGELWLSPAMPGAQAFVTLVDEARERGVRVRTIEKPVVWESPEGVQIVALFPDRPLASTTPPNTASVVVRVSYGAFAALITGDAPRAVERYMVALYGPALAAPVLVVGHHGSRTSTDDRLLAAVRPRIAVISAGAHNRFGHPHAEVRTALARAEIPWCLTARDGDVVIYSDGITIETPPCGQRAVALK